MCPPASSTANAVTPFSIRSPRERSFSPALRLLPGGDAGEQPRTQHRARSRPAATPLLPVAYRGGYLRRLLAPRRPVERVLLSVIQETYLAGASTRMVDALAETVGIAGIDPPAVAAQARIWDANVDAFQKRQLHDGYPFLMVVETPALVRKTGGAETCHIALAVGRSESGARDVLGFGVRADGATVEYWQAFLNDLKGRGMTNVRTVTSDRIDGLVAAMARVYPGARWQRCRERFVTEALSRVPRQGRSAVESSLRAIFAQPDSTSALEALARVRAQFEFAFPELVAMLEEPLGALLTFYQVAPAHRRMVSSLNALASVQRDVRQSCQLVGIFPNRQALLRLAGTILQEAADEWAARPRRTTVAAAGLAMSALARPWVLRSAG
ncbi:MAG TPA: transposase [Candidatus Dormibacteraeota bacterium]|nr:transposase [Candidatus Dormibacteraeota bacterium]